MFVLGLTGPTGSGKSTVASVLKRAGFEVLDADRTARRAVEPGTVCLKELASEFGMEILNPDGSLNRKALASAAFSDPSGVKRLNAVTHPHIMKLMETQLEDLRRAGFSKAVLDAPALFESGAEKLCTKVAAVLAPDEIRIDRIVARDGITREEARLRANAQPPRSYYTQRADAVIENDGNEEHLRMAAERLAELAGGVP